MAEREPLQREAIIEAGRQLVVTGGLEALSLRRLASQLGVTAPALYAHVRDKQDLLRAIAEIEFDRLVARFDSKLDRAQRAPANTFIILGFWLEDAALGQDDAFATALAHGFARFATFLGASKLDATAIREPLLRHAIEATMAS